MPGPDEQTTPETIPALGTLASTPEKVREVGLDRLSRAVAAAAEERLGIKMTDPHYTQRLEAGEIVPIEMRDEAGIDFDDAGALRNPWMKNWQNLSVWKRNWHERQAVEASEGNRLLSGRASDVLTDEELSVLEQLGLTERFAD